jgi:DNA-directed RNA polymerase specialized sigma24 family protein
MNTKQKSNNETAELEMPQAANDTQLRDDLVDRRTRASESDRRALGAIAAAIGPSLLKEARAAMKGLDGDAEDVVQDFFLFLVEGGAPFNVLNEHASHWMHRMVRVMAQHRRREKRRRRRFAHDDDDD